MTKEIVRYILEALAVGDSFSKSTEFASRSQIQARFREINDFLSPEESLSHKDMFRAQVTDDTEQNIYILSDYIHSKEITADLAAKSLLRWFSEAPDPLKYIGPSSLRAINAIKAGVDIQHAGSGGTSCGGIMRVPAPFLCSRSIEELEHNIICTLLPTHNSNAAMEAALGYGYALHAMLHTDDIGQIIEQAILGCKKGRMLHSEPEDATCLPSCSARIEFLANYMSSFRTADELLDFLFYCIGTTISSCDVFTAAFALFLWCREDVYKAIQLSAMLGGDTDTIGCLAAVLCCTFRKGHNIPSHLITAVSNQNHIDFETLAEEVAAYRSSRT